ncbi:MAG: DUF3500 domain-containing protein [Gemmataceae bacterium]
MSKEIKNECPECHEFDRRGFLRGVGGVAAGVAAGGLTAVPNVQANPNPTATRQPRPAEVLIRELFAGLTDDQKDKVVYPWNHKDRGSRYLTRERMYNRPLGRRIGDVYTQAQKELVERILKAMSNGEEGYTKMSRNGTFDGSRNFQSCGAYIFGDPTGNQYAYVFSGHHLTVRCDGNTIPGSAFGGPIYYGHSPNGYSRRNCFYYQTEAVQSVFEALSAQQRRAAILTGTPGEHERSIQFRDNAAQIRGLVGSELTRDQLRLVDNVMQKILSPYRQEDADEVMQIIRRNGGIENIRLAFYQDRNANDNARWHFWRLEGPGFVWNFRVLPHVHTYVNIAVRNS